jgi:glycerol uptake facilitator-like aquaporin
LTSDAALSPAGLVAVALTHGFALFVTVSIAANISGGHVNPAVTFGLFLGGHISLVKGIFYWIAQLVGAALASYLLIFVTAGGVSASFHAFSLGTSISFASLALTLFDLPSFTYCLHPMWDHVHDLSFASVQNKPDLSPSQA